MAELINKVRKTTNIKFDKEYCWSDSTITICWIQGCPSKWKTFVSNRVATIQGLTNKENWLHVGSKSNPADLISRGMTPERLKIQNYGGKDLSS